MMLLLHVAVVVPHVSQASVLFDFPRRHRGSFFTFLACDTGDGACGDGGGCCCWLPARGGGRC